MERVERAEPDALLRRALIEGWAPPAALVDGGGAILRLSGDTSPFLRLPEGELVTTLQKMAHPDLRGPLAALLEAVAAGAPDASRSVERGGDGERRLVKLGVRAVPGGDRPLFAVTFEERDGADERLARTRRRLEDYRTALDASAIVAITDARGTIVHVNDRFCRTSGYDRAELLGRTHRVVNSGVHGPEVFQDLWSTIESGRIWRGLLCNRAKDGSRYWVDTTITPLPTDADAPERYLAIRHDVTARVRALRELEASERRFRTLFDHAGVGIALMDDAGRIVEASPALGRFLGYPREEILGVRFGDFALREDADLDRALFEELGRGERESYEVRKRYRRKDGDVRCGQTAVSMIRGEEAPGPRVIGVVQDVTELCETEDRLRDQAALARIGEMAAVVAHEVKNPLAGILASVKVIGSRLPAGAPERDVITTIAERIGTLNELVEDLLMFARPHEPHVQTVDLLELLARVGDEIASDEAFGDARFELRGQSAKVEVDPGLLERALVNLAINAVQAMHGGGTLRVEVEADGPTCRVTLLDRGPGIAEELRARVFDPFFTTKSRGAGLGLATARRAVEAHGGTLELRPRPGGGTAAVVTLPRAARGAPREARGGE